MNNNKAYSSTKILPFKANYGQDPRIGFEMNREIYNQDKEDIGKSKSDAGKGTERNKEIYE